MMIPKIQIRMLSTGEVKQMTLRDARLLVACRKAEYVSADAAQTYDTKVMTAAPAKRGPGRPPKKKEQ